MSGFHDRKRQNVSEYIDNYLIFTFINVAMFSQLIGLSTLAFPY
jgi:hypothetical protein